MVYVDSDDWVSLTLYNKFVKALNSAESYFDTYMFNYTSYFKKPDLNRFIDLFGVQADKWHIKPNHLYHFTDCTNPFSGNMGVWNKIYEKKLLSDNGLKFEEDYIFEDQLFFLKTFVESKGIYINFEIQYFYRQNEVSTIHNLGGNTFDIFRIFGLIEETLKKKNLYEKYKYVLLQHKYQEYNGLFIKILAPLKQKFFMTAKQNLIDTSADFSEDEVKKLINSNIYFDIISMGFEDFIKKYR